MMKLLFLSMQLHRYAKGVHGVAEGAGGAAMTHDQTVGVVRLSGGVEQEVGVVLGHHLLRVLLHKHGRR